MENNKNKKSNKKSGRSYDRFRNNRPVDIVNTCFLIFITTFYPIYMHRMYFDITGTRAKVFELGGLFYVILLVMAVVIEVFMIRYYEPESVLYTFDEKPGALPEFWAVLFFVANLIAFFIAPDKKAAWLGSTGRYMGLCMMLILVLVFVCLSLQTYISRLLFVFLFVSSSLSMFIAFLQHFGLDPFGLKAKVVPRQKELFISTFGNLNTYGSYLAIIIPIIAAVFIFESYDPDRFVIESNGGAASKSKAGKSDDKSDNSSGAFPQKKSDRKKTGSSDLKTNKITTDNISKKVYPEEKKGNVFFWLKANWIDLLSAILLFEGGMAIIPAKSDNVYLGVGVGYIVLFYLAVMNKRLTEYLFSILFLSTGLSVMSILNKQLNGSQKHINGIAEIVENPGIMLSFVCIVVWVLACFLIFRKVNYFAYKRFQCGWLLLIFSFLLVMGGLAAFVFGVRSGSSIFKFDYNWGTYRGYIWSKCWQIHADAGPLNKFFGYGTESIARLMNQRFYEEMLDVTGKKYDNAHNELLQYLVTTGLFGLITFIGTAFSSFIYIWKRARGDRIALAFLMGGVGYFAQCIVTLNQPITSPFFFVLLAAGIGYIRYRNSKRIYYLT